ncbi:Glucose-6-phosphate/phosphate translocator 2 chloroplastic, partial [Bienertia sinuspersici]
EEKKAIKFAKYLHILENFEALLFWDPLLRYLCITIYLTQTEAQISNMSKSTIPLHYEANHSHPLDINFELPSAQSESTKNVKIGIYFATWWSLNVVFQHLQQESVNAFPYPWLTSTLSLAAGSFIMLVSWAARVADPPRLTLNFGKLCS